MGRDRGRPARARGGADRVGQDPGAFLWSIDRLLTAPGRRRRSGAGSSTSPRSRRSASTSSATCGRRWPASGTPPTGSARPVPDVSVGVRSGDTPARAAQAEHQPAGHPDHHARVAVPDAHQPGARDASGASRPSSSTRCTPSPAPSAAPTSRISLERLDALLEQPAQRIGLSATVRPLDEVARFLGGHAPVEIVAPPPRRWDLKVVVPVEDMTAPGGDQVENDEDGDDGAAARSGRTSRSGSST